MAKGIRGRVAHFRDHSSSNPATLFEYIEDAIVLVEHGKILDIGPAEVFERQGYDLDVCEHYPNKLILSGFIDSHVHAPQLDIVASYGEQLMEWLDKYTFPAEMKFEDATHSRIKTEHFIDALLSHGTTCAMVFATSFNHSVEHLFDIAQQRNMRLISGKILMDRNAPESLLVSAEQVKQDSTRLIERWHKRDRLSYSLTPRFSATSSPDQLKTAGALLKAYPDLYVQTHLSENLNEIALIQRLFPELRDYLDTYEHYGLLGPRSNFAHGIHLSHNEVHRLADSGACVSFCPSSNLFLGSGLFDLETLKAAGVSIALATDVGGGTSLCQFRTMADAYKVCQLKGYSLNALEAFYLASLGAARALNIDPFVGSLDKGKEADFILIDTLFSPLVQQRVENCVTIEEELFVYMTMGDERLVAKTYVAGELQYRRGATI